MRCASPKPQRTTTCRRSRPSCSTRLRARGPRVHCITNAVAQNFTANVLLAAGARAVDDALGRGDRRLRRARRRAAGQSRHLRPRAPRGDRARGRNRRARTACPGCSIRCSSTARRRARPSRVSWWRAAPRRSGSTAPNSPRLAGGEPTHADACALTPATTRPSSACPARPISSATATRFATIANGHPLMAQVTAMGCAASALVARLSRGRAGRVARDRGGADRSSASPARWRPRRRDGPGSFAVAILDALHALDAADAASQRAKVT